MQRNARHRFLFTLSQSGVPTVETCGSMCALCTVTRTRKNCVCARTSWCGVYISCWRLFFPSFIFMFCSLHWTLPPAFVYLHSSSPNLGIRQSVQFLFASPVNLFKFSFPSLFFSRHAPHPFSHLSSKTHTFKSLHCHPAFDRFCDSSYH